MPLISQSNDFKHLEVLDVASLYIRYEELKASLTLLPDGKPDPNAVDDDPALNEMCVILAQLRKKSAGPPKRKAAGTGTRKTKTPEPVRETALDEL